MPFKVIHIVSSFDRINFGIWNAAIFGLNYLEKDHNVRSYVWATSSPPTEKLYPPDLDIQWFGTNASDSEMDRILKLQGHNESTIVVSHGCWLSPTKYAHRLSLKGYKWLYVPHGMLEPWSMSQSALRKKIYYALFEGRYIRTANRIRAVSAIEKGNLSIKLHRKIDVVENGVPVPADQPKSKDRLVFLFLGRLHHKKGIVPLVEAWHNTMKGRTDRKLIIAGPDQGELEKIQPYLSGNVEYTGAVYGNEKNKLLSLAHYFVLPSHSEGFPVSVLEAMSFGVIPLISKGCNFDAVFDNNLGYNVEPIKEQIENILSNVIPTTFDTGLSTRNRDYVMENYSEKAIGDRLFDLYSSM